jgi:hypothetical protein
MVGTIKYTGLGGAGAPDTDEIPPGSKLAKGQDMGYFKFGGSTVLCLWEPGNAFVCAQVSRFKGSDILQLLVQSDGSTEPIEMLFVCLGIISSMSLPCPSHLVYPYSCSARIFGVYSDPCRLQVLVLAAFITISESGDETAPCWLGICLRLRLWIPRE